MVALGYFLDNYGQNHTDYKDYTAYARENVAFVPAIQKGEKRFVKPVEAFSVPDWGPLGFPILDPTLGKDAVDKLGIKEHPPTSQLVDLLKMSPPTTESLACEWFGILSSHIPGLCNTQSHKCVHTDLDQPSSILSLLYCPHCTLSLSPTILPSPQALNCHHQINATSRVNLVTSCIASCSHLSTLALQQTAF